MIDSNAVDALAEPSERYDAIKAAVESGRVDLLWTHITIDELSAIPDEARRARLLAITAGVCRLVPTGAMVLGYSRLNFCRLGGDDEAFEAFRKGNMRHTQDALIASTAEFEQCALVTEDTRLRGRAIARGIEVWSPADLAAKIGPQ